MHLRYNSRTFFSCIHCIYVNVILKLSNSEIFFSFFFAKKDVYNFLAYISAALSIYVESSYTEPCRKCVTDDVEIVLSILYRT